VDPALRAESTPDHYSSQSLLPNRRKGGFFLKKSLNLCVKTSDILYFLSVILSDRIIKTATGVKALDLKIILEAQ